MQEPDRRNTNLPLLPQTPASTQHPHLRLQPRPTTQQDLQAYTRTLLLQQNEGERATTFSEQPTLVTTITFLIGASPIRTRLTQALILTSTTGRRRRHTRRRRVKNGRRKRMRRGKRKRENGTKKRIKKSLKRARRVHLRRRRKSNQVP